MAEEAVMTDQIQTMTGIPFCSKMRSHSNCCHLAVHRMWHGMHQHVEAMPGPIRLAIAALSSSIYDLPAQSTKQQHLDLES